MLKEGYFDKVYYRFWLVDEAFANIFAIHGLGGHCLWFDEAGKLFTKNKINFFSFDLPGFGQSKYPIDGVTSYKVWINVTRDLLNSFLINYFVACPVFILGHSMGALIAVLLSEKVRAHGWILSAPAFEGAKKVFPTVNFVLPVLIASLFKPKQQVLVPFGPDLLTRNKDTQEKIKKDPFRITNLSADVYKHVYFLSLKAKRSSKLLNEPVLMLVAGNDMICSNGAAERFFNDLKLKDKSKKIYTNFFHDLFVEDDLTQIVDDITGWMKLRCEKP